MNGRAPNSPDTGSQVSVCQNCQPNSRIERIDCRYSSTPIAATRTISSTAKTPVPTRNTTSSERAPKGRNAIGYSLIFCERLQLHVDDDLGQRRVAELAGELLAVGQRPLA